MGIGFQRVSHSSPPTGVLLPWRLYFALILLEHSNSSAAFYGEEEQDGWRGSQRE